MEEPQKRRPPRPKREETPEVKYSKALSYILRHGAAKEGLHMRPDGYVTVESVLKRPKVKGLDLDGLQAIVRDNAKQRFALKEELDGQGKAVLWIKANQGHSVAVEDLDLVPITSPEEAPVVVHGTYERFWPLIEKEGLRVMTRNHMHFAAGLADENTVTSGMRSSCNVFIYIDTAKALEGGIEFLRSANGVILTSGKDGVLEPKYFKEVVHKSGKRETMANEGAANDAGQYSG